MQEIIKKQGVDAILLIVFYRPGVGLRDLLISTPLEQSARRK